LDVALIVNERGALSALVIVMVAPAGTTSSSGEEPNPEMVTA
jgi:hypothetical protein